MTDEKMPDLLDVVEMTWTTYLELKVSVCAEAGGPVDAIPIVHALYPTGLMSIPMFSHPSESMEEAIGYANEVAGEAPVAVWLTHEAIAKFGGPGVPFPKRGDLAREHSEDPLATTFEVILLQGFTATGDECFGQQLVISYDDHGQPSFDDGPFGAEPVVLGDIPELIRRLATGT